MKNASIFAVGAVLLIFGGIWVNGALDRGVAEKETAALARVMQDNKDALARIKITDTKIGTGAEATPGKTAVVHYTGRLENGTKFDSSLDRGTPFPFTLGAGEVIKGWDLGVQGMKVGGKRTLVIPSDLAYGESGAGGGAIPPNATLTFQVELLEVK